MEPPKNTGPDDYGFGPPAASSSTPDYTHQYSQNRLQDIQKEVDQVTNIMGKNVEKVVQRGENLDQLQAKADNLSTNANQFQQTSTRLKRKMWWKNIKMMIVIGVVVGVIVIIIIVAAVNSSQGSSGGGETPPANPSSSSNAIGTNV